MVWQSALFLGVLLGLPVLVAWLVGGDRKAKRAEKLATSNGGSRTVGGAASAVHVADDEEDASQDRD